MIEFIKNPVDHDLYAARDLILSLPGKSTMEQIEVTRLQLEKARDEGEYAMLCQLENLFMSRGLHGQALDLLREVILVHPQQSRGKK
jgi:hypothetical protein